MSMRLLALTGVIAIILGSCGTAADLNPTQSPKEGDLKGQSSSLVLSGSMQAELDKVKATLGTVQAERDELAGQAAVFEAERDELAGQVLTVEAERDELLGQVASVEMERDELAGQVAVFETQQLLVSSKESGDVTDTEVADPCRLDNAVESIKDLTSRHFRFEALFELASSTPRIGLSRVVGDMTDTELDLLDIVDVPDCAAEAFEAHKAWVGSGVGGIKAFMRKESDSTVARLLRVADDARLKAIRTLENARKLAGLPSANLRGAAKQIGTPIPTATPPPPPSEVASLVGSGPAATDIFRLGEGLAIFNFSHEGDSNFSIWLFDSVTGKRVDLLVNKIGAITGSTAVRIPSTGSYILDVSADGIWAVIVSQ